MTRSKLIQEFSARAVLKHNNITLQDIGRDWHKWFISSTDMAFVYKKLKQEYDADSLESARDNLVKVKNLFIKFRKCKVFDLVTRPCEIHDNSQEMLMVLGGVIKSHKIQLTINYNKTIIDNYESEDIIEVLDKYIDLLSKVIAKLTKRIPSECLEFIIEDSKENDE
jgi:hypothetical protein